MSFSKTIKIARVWRTSALWSLWKTRKCMFFPKMHEKPYYFLLILLQYMKSSHTSVTPVHSPTPFKHCFHCLLAKPFQSMCSLYLNCYIHVRFSIESVQTLSKKWKFPLLLSAAVICCLFRQPYWTTTGRPRPLSIMLHLPFFSSVNKSLT
jgi:hypothetical protein